MRELPILFSGPMVRAILEGRKTQTRRILKVQPPPDCGRLIVETYPPTRVDRDGNEYPGEEIFGVTSEDGDFGLKSRYKVGDRLWVREEHYRFGHWEPVPGVKTKAGRMKWRFVPDSDGCLFESGRHVAFRRGRHHKDPETPAWHKRIGRFMPRALSRLTLEVTDVRVERLQDISEEDALAEGVEVDLWDQAVVSRNYAVADPKAVAAWFQGWREDCLCWSQSGRGCEPYVKADFIARASYRTLWESINGPGSWDANFWVWVYGFRRVA